MCQDRKMKGMTGTPRRVCLTKGNKENQEQGDGEEISQMQQPIKSELY